jgi:hypothetical protein
MRSRAFKIVLLDVSPQAYRILTKATINNTVCELTFEHRLDQAIADDNAYRERVFAIRAELEAMVVLPNSTEAGDDFFDLVAEWGRLDRYGIVNFLNDVSRDKAGQ